MCFPSGEKFATRDEKKPPQFGYASTMEVASGTRAASRALWASLRIVGSEETGGAAGASMGGVATGVATGGAMTGGGASTHAVSDRRNAAVERGFVMGMGDFELSTQTRTARL